MKNTPIDELMAQYTAENCDFTDIEWVRKAATLYVDRMEDCQVRCLLHALIQTSPAVTELMKQCKLILDSRNDNIVMQGYLNCLPELLDLVEKQT